MKTEHRCFDIFGGKGSFRDQYRSKDWLATTVGPPAGWPMALRNAVSLIIEAQFPMFVAYGPELTFLYNSAYAPLLDLKHPAALGKPLREIWADLWEDVRLIIDKAVAGEPTYKEDVPRVICRDGHEQTRWFTLSYSPLRDDTGPVAGVLCVLIETTARVRLEKRQALQLELADRFRGLQSADDIMATSSKLLAQHLLAQNVFYAEANDELGTFEVKRDWARTGTTSLVGTNGRIDDYGPTVAATLRSGQPFLVNDSTTDERTVNYAAAYASLGLRSVLVLPLVKRGRLVASLNLHESVPRQWTEEELTLASDIAEQTWTAVDRCRADFDLRASVEAVRQSEERFHTLADNIPQLAWMADATGWIFWYNNRWFEYTGTNLEDMRGWGWQRIHHPDHVQRVTQKFVEHVSKGEEWEDTFPIRGKDGEYRWFLSRAVPIQSKAGSDNTVRWFGTNTDVTAQRESELALLDADRRKDEFLAVLAHELRNPLAPIRTALDIFNLVGVGEPRLEAARKAMSRQVSHMTNLVDDLLDVARISRGVIELRKERCNIIKILGNTVDDFRSNFTAIGVTLDLKTLEENLIVDGDHTRLTQIIANLLQNALKFTRAGDSVTVRATQEEVAGEREAKIEIVDTGAGITGELLPKLFTPFIQVKQDLGRGMGGLGLGLTLVKGLVELHGGKVAVYSAGAAQGSTITIRLPLVDIEASEELTEPIAASTGGLRIVIIDDNEDLLLTMEMMLSECGHKVTAASNAKIGIETVRSMRPDLVLCDIGLPGEMNGYDVAKTLRAFPELTSIPIVAISGYSQQGDRELSCAAGFDAHLSKPVPMEKLHATISWVKSRD